MKERVYFNVNFYHRAGWQLYDQFEVSEKELAITRAKQLTIPFGNAEIIKFYEKEDGTKKILSHLTFQDGKQSEESS